MSKEKTLAKNTVIVSIGKISTQLISFFLLPLYTAYLTTNEYGTVDLLNTLISLIIPIISLKIDQGVFRFLIDERENKQGQKKILTTVIYFMLAQSMIYLLIFGIVSNWINNEYKYFLASNLLATMFADMFLQIARGLGDNKKYTIGSFLTGSSTIVLNVILIAGFKLGAYGMFFSSLIGNIICIIYIILAMRLYKLIEKKSYDKKKLKEIFKYSLPLIPNQISWWIINASDRMIISYMMSVSVNGIYSVANKFSNVINTIYGIFNITWTESAAVNFESEDKDKYFSKIFNLTIEFFGCLCLGIIAYMPFVFGILVNENYNEAYFQIPILIVATLFNILVSFLGSIYVAKKLSKEIAKTSIIAAIINIIVNLSLIKFIGLYAASISTLVAWMSMFIYRMIDSRKYVKIKVDLNKVVSMIIISIIAIACYYVRNNIICILSAIIVTIYAFLMNKQNIKLILNMLKNKLLKKREN